MFAQSSIFSRRVLALGAALLALSFVTACDDDSDSNSLLPGECRSERDCAADEVCIDGFCEFEETDACGGLCNANETCNEASGTCEPTDSTDATDDTTDPSDTTEDPGVDTDPGDNDPPVNPNVCDPACPPNQICQAGQCVDTTCELIAADCTSDAAPILDSQLCRCVACLGPDDCEEGDVCATNGRCITAIDPNRTCQSRSDCGANYCQSGFCVECISSADCGDGLCVRGACRTCADICDEDEICTPQGTCIDASLLDGTCSSAADCVESAGLLGFSGDPSTLACDPTLGCYVMGGCNSGNPDDQQPDPFSGQCAQGAACESTGGLGDLGDFGDFFPLPGLEAGFACSCEDDETACRQGEVCIESSPLPLPIPIPIPGLGGPKTCQPPGGGGDFPFP